LIRQEKERLIFSDRTTNRPAEDVSPQCGPSPTGCFAKGLFALSASFWRLTMSFVAFFFGARAFAQGVIPLPFAKERPITFSAAGGIATFIIVLLLANLVYPKESAGMGAPVGGTPASNGEVPRHV
jgi:hypothetical protein